MNQLSKPKLAILVSKQVDLIISKGVSDRYILSCYDAIVESFESKPWSGIRTNSITIAAAFGLSTYPPADEYSTEVLEEKYLSRCTHVVALWGGGNRFRETLTQAIELDRKVRAYHCDLTFRRVKLIQNSAIAEERE